LFFGHLHEIGLVTGLAPAGMRILPSTQPRRTWVIPMSSCLPP